MTATGVALAMLCGGCPEVASNQPDVTPHEQRSSSRDPTPNPKESTATDGASIVVDEHRKAGVQSGSESLSNQSDPEPHTSDLGTLEEGEISADSTQTLQETPKNPPPRKTSQYPSRYLNPYGNLPEPKQRHSELSIYQSNFIVKRTYHKKVIPEMIKRFDIHEDSKYRFEFAFSSAFRLATIRNKNTFYERLEADRFKFNMLHNRKMSIDEYHTHLANVIELTSDLWRENVGTTE